MSESLEESLEESFDDLTYDYEEDGLLVRRQVDRVVLAKGAWPTLMFLFQELDRNSGKFRAPKMSIVRFKKSRGRYRKHSSFNISNEEQARQIAAVFERWYPKIRDLTQLADPNGEEGDGGGGGGDEAASASGRGDPDC